MRMIENLFISAILGSVSGVVYQLITNDFNGAIMISIIVSQINYHGSTKGDK